MLEGRESKIRMLVSGNDVGGLGRGESECWLGSAMLEGGVRRILIQVFGKDIGGWGEEYRDTVEWQGWFFTTNIY